MDSIIDSYDSFCSFLVIRPIIGDGSYCVTFITLFVLAIEGKTL